MMENLKLYIFTDPMMGLSYEMEPVLRKLETHFPGQIEFLPRMGLLVPDVYQLVAPTDLSQGKSYAITRYNKRLAGIYEDEEALGNLPIQMKGFQLFSPKETSSLPLDLAYEAVRLAAPEKAAAFLYRLRFATIAETRPTTKEDELRRIVRLCNIDEKAYQKAWEESAKELLAKDLSLLSQLGLHTLPAYVLADKSQAVLLQTFRYEDFLTAIQNLTQGKMQAETPVFSAQALQKLLEKHPLISAQEIAAAYEVDLSQARTVAQMLVNGGKADFLPIKKSWFLQKKEPAHI